jgi:hypothetical protein
VFYLTLQYTDFQRSIVSNNFYLRNPHIELTWSETACQLSQHWVRIQVDWARLYCQLSQRRMCQYLRRFHHSALTQFTWSFILHWLSDAESHSAVTWLMRNETQCKNSNRWLIKKKNSSILEYSRIKRKYSKAFCFGLYKMDLCKNPEQKISCNCSVRYLKYIKMKNLILDHQRSPPSLVLTSTVSRCRYLCVGRQLIPPLPLRSHFHHHHLPCSCPNDIYLLFAIESPMVNCGDKKKWKKYIFILIVNLLEP